MTIPVDYRWRWSDPRTGDSLTMLVNPRSMTSPLPEYETETLETGDGVRTVATRRMTETTFAGRVRSLADQMTLRTMLLGSDGRITRGELLLTDHLGRQFEVLVTRAPFVEATSAKFRAEYEITMLVLEGPL